MRTPTRPFAIAAVATFVALTGCSAAEDAAQNAAEEAKAKAASAAVATARRAVCSVAKDIVADGKLSEAERARVTSALDAAEAAGVGKDVTSAVRSAVDLGVSTLPPGTKNAVDQACAS